MPSFRQAPNSSNTGYSRMRVAIVIFGVALLGTIWALVLERVRFETSETISDVIRQNSNLAIAFEEHTIRTLKGIDQALQFVKHEYEESDGKAHIRKLIESGAVDVSLVIFIGVADAEGKTVLSNIPTKPANASDREYFRFHLSEDKRAMFIGKPLLGRVSGKWGIQLSRRISRPDGSFGGIVFASLDPGRFTWSYREANLGEYGVVTLIGLDGIVRARQAGKESTFGEDLRGSTVFALQAKSATGNFLSLGRIGATPRFHSYRTLQEYPLIVTVGRSQSEVLAPLHERARNYYLNAAVMTIVIAAFTALLLLALARQQRMSATLMDKEAHFRALIEHAPDLVLVVDREGIIRYVTPAVRWIGGYEPDELVGHSFLEFVHPEDAASSKEDFSALVANGGLIQCSHRYRHRDGSWLVIETLAKNELDTAAVRGVVVNARDVTAQRRSEEALRESEEQFRQLAAHIPEVFWITDLRENAAIYISPAFEKISGLSIAPLATAWSRWQDRVHPDDRERVYAANQNLRAGSLDHEYRILRADGSTRWVRARGYPVGDGSGAVCRMAGTIEDITERKRAEEVQVQLATIVETSPDAILSAALDSTILSWNAAAEKLFGYSAAEAIGKIAYELIVPAERMDEYWEMRSLVRTGKVVAQVETERVGRGGRRIQVSLSSAPIMNADGELIRVATIFHDIGERKQFARELQRQKELLQTIVDNIPVALAYFDQSGRTDWVNRHWERILGWSREEARARDIAAELCPDPEYRQDVTHCIRAGPATWKDFRTRTKDGRTIDTSWANVLLSDGSSIGIGQDVSERKRDERALSEAKARLQAIFESSPLAVVTLDRAGMVEVWNPAAERMFGWSAAEAIGRFMPSVSDERRQEFHLLLEQEFSGRCNRGLELVRRKKDGSHIDVKLWTAPLRDGDGQISSIVGLFEDVTEHKRAERALQRSEEQLRRSWEEREQLSRDLHDGIVQSIYAVGLGLEHARRLVWEDASMTDYSLSEAIAGLNDVIREVRVHMLGAGPQSLDPKHLRIELEALVQMVAATHTMRFSLELNPIALARLSPEAGYEAFNIVREAVSNSLRHCRGKHGRISMDPRDGGVRLAIEDDGEGFDVIELHRHGQGLRNIAARAQALAAGFDIRSSPGHGTRVMVDIPAGHLNGGY